MPFEEFDNLIRYKRLLNFFFVVFSETCPTKIINVVIIVVGTATWRLWVFVVEHAVGHAFYREFGN